MSGSSSKGERTRQLIVEHALQRASREGFEGLSIGTLARDLKLSKSGLFAHFRSKEQLQLDVLATAESRFVDFVVRPAIREPRGEPRVRALVSRWIRWGMADGPQGGCVFVNGSVEFDDRPGAVRDAVATAQHRWTQTLERAITIAVEEGHFRADIDPAQVAYELYALLLGLHLYGRLLDRPDAVARCRAAVDALIARQRA